MATRLKQRKRVSRRGTGKALLAIIGSPQTGFANCDEWEYLKLGAIDNFTLMKLAADEYDSLAFFKDLTAPVAVARLKGFPGRTGLLLHLLEDSHTIPLWYTLIAHGLQA